MARRVRHAVPAFDAITVEGSLVAPAMLAKIAAAGEDEKTRADYRIPKGLTLRDEIARYFRIGQAQFRDFAKREHPSNKTTIEFVAALLRDVFGFADVTPAWPREHDGRHYVVTLEALGGRTPIVVAKPSEELDHAAPELSMDGRRRSPALALQDWLNTGGGALWGLCCNGERLRLMRDNASLTRPAYIEADLRQMFEADGFADFAALWLLIHASRFGAPGAPTTDCALERWRETASKEGLAARDRLRDGVEAALLALGHGFVAENAELRARLVGGQLPLQDYFSQLLRLVYRLIFLAVAEERGLLHAPDAPAAARRLYAEGYSFGALRSQAIRRAAWDRHGDRWQGLQIVFLALARGEKRLGLAGLGGLFLPELSRDLDNACLSNRALMEAVYRLAWLKDEAVLTAVNWRDMEAEELGSVYESLLELTPRIGDEGRVFSFAEGAEAQGHARKTTGSYYTPDSLVQALLDSALDPVLDRAEGDSENPADALLALRVIDPACGSGHFLLAAARRIASRVARVRSSGVAAASDYRHALRDVARLCLYGVDRNPMAVELTKVALWIETVEPGKPLGFLDANIRCGDSLLGVFDLEALRQGVPDEAYKPLTGDEKETARHFAARNRAEKTGQGALDVGGSGHGRLPPPPPLADASRALRALPEDSVDEIAEKERRLRTAEADPRRWPWRVAADLYVAAFLTPKTGGVPDNRNTVTIPTTGHVWAELAGQQVYGPLIGRAQDLAGGARAFHWPLEFPEAFAAGGFDAVLGNPPWERIKLQEQEFFASRDPDIATATNAAARGRLIAALKAAPPGSRERNLSEEFEAAKRLAEAASVFVRTPSDQGGRFPLSGRGDVNTYALFAELFSRLTGPRGRAGVLVPTGIATDATTAPFFASVIDGRRLAALVDFENRDAIFPAVHRSYKFCLLTLGKDIAEARFSFFLTDPAQLAEPERRFTLSPSQIAGLNPNTRTAPIFRSGTDAELTTRIYSRAQILIGDGRKSTQNGWGAYYLRLIHFGDHKDELVMADQAVKQGFQRDGAYWRKGQTTLLLVWESKITNSYDLHYGSFGNDYTVYPLGDNNKNPEKQFFRYWVSESFFESVIEKYDYRKPWFLAYRDVARSTDERSVIALSIPREPASIKLPVLGWEQSTPGQLLLANLNSIPLDYVARQKLGGISLSFFVLKQLPIIPVSAYSQSDAAWLTKRVLELSYTSYSMAPFAHDVGYDGPPFVWNEERRAHLRAELDAWYARAYGLTRDELRYVLDPADVMGADYPSETFRVLKTNEIARYGEYRTARLVLQAWDRE